MTRRPTEKDLLEGLDPHTAHADELAKLLPDELDAMENRGESLQLHVDADEGKQSVELWETSALWECLGPEFQNMDPVTALSLPGRERQVITQLIELGLTPRSLADSLAAPVSTIADPEQFASLEHGMRERLVRLLAILSWAEDLFEGHTRAAVRWLVSPAKALGGESPISMTGSDETLEIVSDVIGRLQHGIPQ